MSSTLLKILLVLLVAYGGYRWFVDRAATSRQDQFVEQLGELFRNHPGEGPEEAAVRSLFTILAALQEPRPEELEDDAELIRLAARTSERLGRQAELLAEGLVENQKVLEHLGLATQEAALVLITGRSPRIESGPWAGETLVVTRRLSPLSAPEARFALANLIVVPESVADARMPELSVDQEQLIRRFQMIGLLPR